MGSEPGSTAEADYAAFEEKVRRTVYLDNISPQVTKPVLRTALNQFGNVKDISFIPNYTEHNTLARCALVEMEDRKQAKVIVSEITQFPFMMSGMPRPVRARPAEVEMFDDRPRKPGRRIYCRWLDPKEPDFKVGKEIKDLILKQAAEAAFLHKLLLAQQEKLARQQSETLKANYKKFEIIDGVKQEADRLANKYKRKY